jgi:hypothetical protein
MEGLVTSLGYQSYHGSTTFVCMLEKSLTSVVFLASHDFCALAVPPVVFYASHEFRAVGVSL